MKRLTLILLIGLTGCTASTKVFSPVTGKKTFETNANFGGMKLGKDGSLTMTNVDHSTPQREIGDTLTKRGNAVGGVIGAIGALGLTRGL